VSKRKTKPEGETILQPMLWSEDQLPERPELVELVKQGFVHTGKNLVDGNEVLCAQVMEGFLRGVSGRQLARTHGISRNSISGIRTQMEARGMLEPLKKRIARQLGTIIEMGLEDFQDALSTGMLHPSQLPVPLGIFMTHKALVDGDPTVRVETGKPSELSVDQVRAHFDALKRAAITVDSESTAITTKPQ